MYYIKETFPNSDNVSSDILFKSWIDNFKIKENYTSWILSGDIYIYSNSFLPNYSYSLNISNHLFEINNLNLIWKQEIISKKKQDGTPAFNITKFVFNKTINLNNSNIFKQEISNQSIFFNFSFNFNQNIFIDFDIDFKENTRRKFIDQLNTDYCEYEYNYSNTYYLNDQSLEIYIDNLKQNKILFYVPNFFDISKPINEILYVNKNQNHIFKIKYLEMQFKYKVENSEEWKEMKIIKNNIDQIKNFFSIAIDDYYTYDVKSDSLYKTSIKNYKGIFIPKKSIGSIKFNLIFEYDGTIKRLVFDRQFYFSQNLYTNCIEAISINSIDTDLESYKEVVYGN